MPALELIQQLDRDLNAELTRQNLEVMSIQELQAISDALRNLCSQHRHQINLAAGAQELSRQDAAMATAIQNDNTR